MRAEHKSGYKGMTAILRCLDLVLREGNYLYNFTGTTETEGVLMGLHKYPRRRDCKVRGKLELSKIMVSSIISTLALEKQ